MPTLTIMIREFADTTTGTILIFPAQTFIHGPRDVLAELPGIAIDLGIRRAADRHRKTERRLRGARRRAPRAPAILFSVGPMLPGAAAVCAAAGLATNSSAAASNSEQRTELSHLT